MKSPGVLLLLCASMIICISFSNAQLDLSISASSDTPFTVGSVLSLSCQLQDSDTLDDVGYEWMSDCPPLEQCFSGNMTQNISTLSRDTVPVLTSVDSGNYTCFALYGNDTSIQTTFDITVTGVGVYERSSNRIVINGSSFVASSTGNVALELHCIGAGGSGKWTDSQGSEPMDSIFNISEAFQSTIMSVNGNLSRDSEGYYTCSAEDENEMVTSIRVGIFLNMPGPPPSVILSINQNPVLINSVITLQCIVPNVTQVSPQLIYSWSLNSALLSQYSTSSINITLTNASQFGLYSCNISNSFGSVGDTVNLQQAFAPTITQSPASVTVIQPANASFTCVANAVPLPAIQWMRNGSTLSSGPDYNIVITNNSATDISSTLTVVSSTPLDDGDYSCVAANNISTVTASATLTVHVVPTISVAMSAYTVNENSTVTFQCNGTGVPEPVITWYRNGTLITDDRFSTSNATLQDSSTLIYNVTGSLTLNNAYDTDTDTGYSCVANNTAGNATDSFNLTVNFGTRLSTGPVDQTVTEYNDISFSCTVSGYERPTISWSFSGTNLSNNTNGVTIMESFSGSYDITSTITLTNVNRSSAGLYQCTGRNGLRSVTAGANLTVNFIPDITQFPVNKTVVQPANASFTCAANAVPLPTIQWMRNGSTLSFGPDYSIVITTNSSTNISMLTVVSSTPLDAGDYACVAANNISTNSTLASLTVHVVPTISVAMSAYTVNENSTVTFQCNGTGVPEPVITWYRNGKLVNDTRFSTLNATLRDSSTLIYNVTGSLTLTNAYDTDTNTGYSCVASNTAGTATDSFGLTVNFGTRLSAGPVDQTVTEYNNVSFSCTVSGYERPTISWSFSDNNLSNNSNGVTIMESFSGSYDITSIITLTNVSRSSAGLYQCTGRNGLNNVTAEATLTVNFVSDITEFPASVTVIQPANASFTCAANAVPLPTIQWMRNGSLLSSNSNYSIATANSSLTNISSTLTVLSSTPLDAGEYSCFVANGVKNVTASATLTVHVLPSVSVAMAAYTVDENSTVTFQCTGTGVPEPVITWYRNGALISDARFSMSNATLQDSMLIYNVTGSLNLTNAYDTDTDTGYSCVASNTAGNATDSFGLTVNFGTRLSAGPVDQTVTEYNDISFSCTVSGYERPTISWSFSGTNLSNNVVDGVTIMESIRGSYDITSTITLTNVSRSSAGLYQCTGRNGLRSVTAGANLTVNFIPDITQFPANVTVIQPANASLTCAANAVPLPTIQWMRNGSTLSFGPDYSIVITTNSSTNISMLTVLSSTPLDAGDYACVAANNISTVNASATLTVYVVPTISSSMDTYTVNENGSVSFQCTGTGVPAPSITWYRNGSQLLNNSRTTIAVNSPRQDGATLIYEVIGVLRITPVYDNDSDTVYTCTASNIAGNVTDQFELDVLVAPVIIGPPLNANVTHPSPFSFTCIATSHPQPTIVWYKTTEGTNDNTERVRNGNRIAITEAPSGDRLLSSTITVSGSIPSDAGEYTCEASNIVIGYNNSATVIVNVRPSILYPSPGAVFRVNESFSITIQCSSTGLPSPSLSWYRNSLQLTGEAVGGGGGGINGINDRIRISDTVIQAYVTPNGIVNQTNQTLTLSANRTDTDNYTCRADNVGQAEVAFSIFVQVRPVVISLAVHVPLVAVESMSQLISFRIDDAAPPVSLGDIYWRFSPTFSNDPYSSDTVDITGLETRLGNSVYTFSNDKRSLTVSQLNQTDEGRYFLIAVNPAGEHYSHIDVIIHGPPYFLEKPTNTTRVNGETATFTCGAIADPVHHTYWLYNGTVIANTSSGLVSDSNKYSIVTVRNDVFDTNFGRLTIRGLVFDDRGVYQCTVYNNISSLNAAATLTVHVKPIVYSISNSTSLLIESSLSLFCVATGYPFVTITWKKNSQNIPPNTPNITMTTTPVSSSNYAVNESILDVARLGAVGELAFTSVARDDTASYTCVADNSLPVTSESQVANVTVLERPDPPINVTVQSYTSRTVNVSWFLKFDGNNPIKGYFLYQKDLDRDGNFTLVRPSSLHSYTTETETWFRITDGIIPYTKYQFTVVACNGVSGTNCSGMDRGIPSTPVRIDPDAPDSPPFDCTATPTNSSEAISLTWFTPLQPNGLILTYNITYLPLSSTSGRDYSTETNTTVSTANNDTDFIVTNLYKATTYSFSLQAFTVVGGSPIATNICSTSTIEDVPEGVPQNVVAVSDTSTSIRLSWTPPDVLKQNGRITEYQIRYALPFQSLAEPINVTAPNTNMRIDGLEKYTIYNFSVSAGTARGYGPFSNWTSLRTLNDTSSVPRNLMIAGSPGRTNITVQWTEPASPNGIISRYKVYYQPSKASAGASDTSFDPSEKSVTVSSSVVSTMLIDLFSDSNYTISVTAINGAGESGRSNQVMATTPSSPPPPPSPPGIPNDAVDGRKVRIQLVKPSSINGPISHYHVVAILLREDSVSAPSTPPDIKYPSLSSFATYTAAQDTYDGSADIAYIAAEFSDSLFPSNGDYIIGEETEPNDRSSTYTNGQLRYGTPYTFFLRAYPYLTSGGFSNKKQTGSSERQYEEFTSSNYTAVVTTATNPGPAIAGSVVTVLLVIIIIVVIVLVVLFLVYRKRTGILTFKTNENLQEMKRITSDMSIPSMPHMESTDATMSGVSIAMSEHYEGHPPISVAEFVKIVDRLHANDNYMFSQEYEDINRSSPSPSVDVCLNPMNKLRNRYANIQCYDHSRVRLTPVEDFPHDYINANFIHGYNRKNEFIATQGPLPDTIGDFWRMVWDYEVPTIVMLTNLQEKMRVKCTQYWPDTVGQTEHFGYITVTFVKSTSHADYCIRDFEIQTSDEKTIRNVKQYHYTSWPDFGVPRHPTPLIQFLHTVRRHHNCSDKRPLIIHCSAGVGRTGTLITIDAEMQRAEHERELNPYQFVRQMRENRNHMVQTEAQYIFAHDALVEILNTGKTDINIEQLEDRMAELEVEDVEGETGYHHEFQRLQNERTHFDDFASARNDANKDKNRLHNALPYDHNRVKLTKVPGEIGSDYINASYIDGYKAKNTYIAAQGPKENTVKDFWKMICEQQVTVIVMLTNLEERGQVMGVQYWPSNRGEEMIFGSAKVVLQLTNNQQDYTHRQFKVTYSPRDSKPEMRIVHHFNFTTWPKSGAPADGAGMIDLIDQVQKRQQQTGNKPILVHCSAGIGRTGAFCALSIAIERVKLEHIVNIYNIVKHLRTQRAHMVQNLDQYIFIYRAVMEYARSLDNYANFNQLSVI